MIEIRPMDEGYLHLTCLHHGPVDSETWVPSWDTDAKSLPPHPWSDETIQKLGASHPGMSHGNCKCPAGAGFLREMIRRYGTCAMLAWDDKTVVGQLRFYPMEIARRVAVSQTDPSPILDCTLACEPEEDEGTLWVQCVMTSVPYEDAEGASKAGARKGIGLELVRSLVKWAADHEWRRIVKVAHCDLDWFYGIQGGGGKAFWEKAGFHVAGSFYKRAWQFKGNAWTLVQEQMARKGMTEQDIWTWYRMAIETRDAGVPAHRSS